MFSSFFFYIKRIKGLVCHDRSFNFTGILGSSMAAPSNRLQITECKNSANLMLIDSTGSDDGREWRNTTNWTHLPKTGLGRNRGSVRKCSIESYRISHMKSSISRGKKIADSLLFATDRQRKGEIYLPFSGTSIVGHFSVPQSRFHNYFNLSSVSVSFLFITDHRTDVVVVPVDLTPWKDSRT